MESNLMASSRYFIYQTLENTDITDQYVGWLNNPDINQFLEVRHTSQSKHSIEKYVQELRARYNCEIFTIKTKKFGSHIGNVAITNFDIQLGEATYGLMIGEKKYIGFAGAEASLFIIQKIFSDERIVKLDQGALLQNYKAISLLKSLGFTENSTQLQRDQKRFSLTRKNWESGGALLARKIFGT
jgi:RimJ/RimL family protein N-acetyltransferase